MAVRIINEDNGKIVVPSKSQAWKKIKELSDDVFNLDAASSDKAKYNVYRSLNNPETWISELGDRFELNTPNGTKNIWIDPRSAYTYTEYELRAALHTISNAVYDIDDNVSAALLESTNLGQARKLLYDTYAQIKEILDQNFPDSDLYRDYNL